MRTFAFVLVAMLAVSSTVPARAQPLTPAALGQLASNLAAALGELNVNPSGTAQEGNLQEILTSATQFARALGVNIPDVGNLPGLSSGLVGPVITNLQAAARVVGAVIETLTNQPTANTTATLNAAAKQIATQVIGNLNSNLPGPLKVLVPKVGELPPASDVLHTIGGFLPKLPAHSPSPAGKNPVLDGLKNLLPRPSPRPSPKPAATLQLNPRVVAAAQRILPQVYGRVAAAVKEQTGVSLPTQAFVSNILVTLVPADGRVTINANQLVAAAIAEAVRIANPNLNTLLNAILG